MYMWAEDLGTGVVVAIQVYGPAQVIWELHACRCRVLQYMY